MSRIFITGDTHDSREMFLKLSSRHFNTKGLTKDDYLIILGDFGAVTWDNTKESIYNRNWLNNKPFTTLFIDGNHDNFNILDNLPTTKMFDAEVGVLSDTIFHLKRGQIYNINDCKFLAIGGAYSIDKIYRKKDISWWSRETLSAFEEKQTEKNVIKNNYNIDYVLSHTIFPEIGEKLIQSKTIHCPVSSFLRGLDLTLNFNKWFFGHFHNDKIINEKYYALYNTIYELDINKSLISKDS